MTASPNYTERLGVPLRWWVQGTMLVATLLLAAVNFPVHAQQGSVDPAMMTRLATLYLPIAATFGVISILILLAYGIDQKKHEANLADLAGRGLVGLPEDDVDALLAGAPLAPSTEVAAE